MNTPLPVTMDDASPVEQTTLRPRTWVEVRQEYVDHGFGLWVRYEEAVAYAAAQKAPPVPAAVSGEPAWQPIETPPPEGVVVVVGWLDQEDVEHPERHAFDAIEDGVWMGHANEYEHYLMVGGGSMGPGPKEIAPYMHWMPLPAAPAAVKEGA